MLQLSKVPGTVMKFQDATLTWDFSHKLNQTYLLGNVFNILRRQSLSRSPLCARHIEDNERENTTGAIMNFLAGLNINMKRNQNTKITKQRKKTKPTTLVVATPVEATILWINPK